MTSISAVNRIAALEREVAILKEVLQPFADFADESVTLPNTFVINKGSSMARRQLTMGDCYRARAVLEGLKP
jgi:hypothetical protein